MTNPINQSQNGKWLTLSEASELLGVHPTTLRAWADAGQIQIFRTPGGHRRFAENDVRRFLAGSRSFALAATSDALTNSALQHTRADLAQETPQNERWLTAHTAEERSQRRESGKRLLALAIQFIVRERGREEILAEGRALGKNYGQFSAAQGLSLVDTTRAFMFFRESLGQAVTTTQLPAGTIDADTERIRMRLTNFMDEVLYAALGAYDNERKLTD